MRVRQFPSHVAIVMDGNGRWAERKGLPRIEGHYRGAQTAEAMVEFAAKKGIRYLSLFAFSKENWFRSPEEVNGLFRLLEQYLAKGKTKLVKNGIRFRLIGEKEELPENLVRQVEEVEEVSRRGERMQLNLFVNYTGRAEILSAIKKIAVQVLQGSVKPEEIDAEIFQKNLWTSDIPEPDLVIRTAEEYRLSNFMLWQVAYSEFWFTPVLWPDFTEEDFQRALDDYARRERRFGRIPTKI